MSFKDIQKLKKQHTAKIEKKFIRMLFVGTDLFTIGLYLKAKEKYGRDQVQLLLEETLVNEMDAGIELNASSFRNLLGPAKLRGEANGDLVNSLYPDIGLRPYTESALFFKDLQWRSFDGRAKPEKLKWGEEFYTQSRFDFALDKIFPWLSPDSNTLSSLNSEAWNFQINKLSETVPDDLIDRGHFLVNCSNGMEITCEKLIWGGSPSEFLSLYGKKELLSDGFIQACEATQTPSSLYIDLIYESPITDKEETLFIPLSYTHEWGHFIGEFKKHDEVTNHQIGRFVHFVDPDHTNEEEISKKIRILKKNLEKIFPSSKKISVQERIIFSPETPCLKIDDLSFEHEMKKYPYLYFSNVNAPLVDSSSNNYSFEYSKEKLSHFSRGLLRYRFLQDDLELN